MRRCLVLMALLLAVRPAAARERVTLWAAYGGREEVGLRAASSLFQSAHPELEIAVLTVPFGAYLSKLEAAIPTGNGPDVFIDSHERLPELLSRDLLESWPTDPIVDADFSRSSLDALSEAGTRYGMPLALKSLALYVNTRLVPEGRVTDTVQLRALGRSLPRGVYPLVFEADNPYYAAAVLHAFGGELLSPAGAYALLGTPAERTLDTLAAWTRNGVVPEAPSGDLVKRLFSNGGAATAISGPWLAADLPSSLEFSVQPLPALSEANGRPLLPYVTIEAAFVSRHTRHAAAAFALAQFLAGEAGARIRAEVGGQVVALRSLRETFADARLRAFSEAAASGIPMPVHPHMHAVWEPAGRALQSVLRGNAEPKAALHSAAALFARNTRAPAAPARPGFALFALGALCLWGAFRLFKASRDASLRRELRRSATAYRYLSLTTTAVVALVILPLAAGVAISFFSGRGRDFVYVGLGNYWDILSGGGGALLAPGSFWFVLAVTVLWTALNVALHLLIGATLALLLNQSKLAGSKLYRVLLILPWAVPSYVTALTWKGMFHRQFGAINALLELCGVRPIDWFSRWLTAFSADLLTNVWLGFPFMMVVTLGALTSISKDVYEAADVDGASGIQRLRLITLPLLRPVLAPALVMGAAWTFNGFNVVFLVSGGEPGGTTDILVSEAYRWAFTRSSQYGYAAAYAVLIFGLLLLMSRGAPLLSRAKAA